ncbi:hypothetical protein D7V93_18050 [Corallococcus llansteffanensis]|uniref:Uncharacterized protein n=1 Tax=Corallococcus llansteffanensis TaxID=2316731 RepID=A0A3A8PMZ2_9BACT|nr:hypothetical protein D7V93_18050 [Corallococcus llansteffanensis]
MAGIMSKFLRFLLAAIAVVTLAPVASARAEPCETACTCATPCSMACTHEQGGVINCARWGGDCIGACFSPEPTASVAVREEGPEDATSAQVCSEEHQDQESSASVES